MKTRLRKIIYVTVFLIMVGIVINAAPNYIKNKNADKINVIINNGDVTDGMKFAPYIEDGIVYISTKDIANFFDENIFYDNKYNQIITTSDMKIATLKIDDKEMNVNGAKIKIYGTATKKDGQFYLPFSELKDVYNVEVDYHEKANIITIDSLNREQKRGNASKNTSIKYKETSFSKTVAKANKGDSLYVISQDNSGWTKVRTNEGIIGYTKNITNIYTARENLQIAKQINGKVSLVWDYYYRAVPDRTGTTINGINVISPSFIELVDEGQGDIVNKIGTDGQKYVTWAHNAGYKVWAMISNNGYTETTSEILNDYNLRYKLINNIVNMCLQYNLDGINLDFENINIEDKDMLSRFIIELEPRLKEYSKVLSVDVTAPDGSENWSECYDRNLIGSVADYIIFMGYDQYGSTSPKEGTTAGADWVELNIKKFIDREEVDKDKLILGMPFYTRLWTETNGNVTNKTVTMKNIDKAIPNGVKKTWDKDLKQYYIEYTSNGSTYKMWIEDEESLKAKFDLMKRYNLAGAAYWQKDFETNGLWNFIAQQF